jgi:hypothetical protein
MSEISAMIAKLIDGWCERRALRPLGIILGGWPPPNGFSDEWEHVWAAMRHLRAMCRDDLARCGETHAVDQIIADLSKRLFPQEPQADIEQIAEDITARLFGKQS